MTKGNADKRLRHSGQKVAGRSARVVRSKGSAGGRLRLSGHFLYLALGGRLGRLAAVRTFGVGDLSLDQKVK